MKKIDLNFTVTDFKGEPAVITNAEGAKIGEVNAAEELGRVLAFAQEKDNNKIVKYWGWATTLGKRGVLSLDEADINTLKEFVNNSELFVWVKAQILAKIK